MIKNVTQYLITREQLEKFRESLAEVEALQPDEAQFHPVLRQAYINSFESTIEELEAEIRQYEAIQELRLSSTAGTERTLVGKGAQYGGMAGWFSQQFKALTTRGFSKGRPAITFTT